jgi:hypothetical protein
MASYELRRIPYSWRLTVGDLCLDAVNPHLDQGAIRATLTVRQGEAILFRDTTDLTSQRTRAKVLAQLVEKGFVIEDKHLIALDEACSTQRPSVESRENIPPGGSPGTSGKVADFPALTQVFYRWLLMRDPDVLAVTLGAVAAHPCQA